MQSHNSLADKKGIWGVFVMFFLNLFLYTNFLWKDYKNSSESPFFDLSEIVEILQNQVFFLLFFWSFS